MGQLSIRFKRHADGSASISCTRADGSVTWQRQNGKLGMVFPPHDLTHYAVETVLGCRAAFYGLLARGWEINDFAKPWPRGPVPAEAIEVELLVGCFDAERRQAVQWTAQEFRDHCATYVESRAATNHEVIAMPRALTESDLHRVRAVRDALLQQWQATAAGDELVLEFAAG